MTNQGSYLPQRSGFGAIELDPNKPGSYSDRFPYVTLNEYRNLEKLVSFKYGGTGTINSIPVSFLNPADAVKKQTAQNELNIKVSELNTSKLVVASQATNNAQQAAAAKAAADKALAEKAKAQADTLAVLKQNNLINNSNAVSEAQKIYSSVQQSNATPNSTVAQKDYTVPLVIGTSVLLVGTIITVAVVSRKKGKNNE